MKKLKLSLNMQELEEFLLQDLFGSILLLNFLFLMNKEEKLLQFTVSAWYE